MARTKAEYIAEGRASYNHPLRISGQITDTTMPLFGTGTSWQAKAFAEGWRIEHHLAEDRKRQNCPACAAGIPVKVHTGVKLGAGQMFLDGRHIGNVESAYVKPAVSASDIRREERIDAITRGWITAALWSTGATALDGEELENLDDYEFSENAKKAARVICAAFYDTHTTDVNAYAGTYRPGDGSDPYECAGHDLWLTANGHGAGFWDRGLGNLGKRLADACGFRKQFDHIDLYIADDGFVNLC